MTADNADRKNLSAAVDQAIAGQWDAAHNPCQSLHGKKQLAGYMWSYTRSKAMCQTPATGIDARAETMKAGAIRKKSSKLSRLSLPTEYSPILN